ncbi:MAG: MBL fold metallo-hydrolase [Simkaniaceae bacterium]|nr:MBL fold metallo-hydrolase [Simkaniaceae bacterium]
MPLFCPLASGSKGNAIYVESHTTKLLIDAGLSFKGLQERLTAIQVDINQIQAVLVTHEHIDHIRGLERLQKVCSIPILANKDTARAILEEVKDPLQFKIFATGETFQFGDITIHPFSIQHDTQDPVAFTLSFNGIKIGVCTDLGFVTSLVKAHLQECDYLYIEANHEPSMVHACRRPPMYKQRVLSRQGHISNKECAELVEAIGHSNLKHIYLAHLSEECNHPELALKTVSERKPEGASISIAAQHQISLPIHF